MWGELTKRGLLAEGASEGAPPKDPMDSANKTEEKANTEKRADAQKDIMEGVKKDALGRAKMGPIFHFLWFLVRGCCRLFFLLKITGEEQVKENNGGYIVVANHVSY